MNTPARRRVDAKRRAEIGAAKRLRTRAEIVAAALDLFGRPQGRNTRIEDLCARAHISRGTFYNYFEDISQLLEALSAAVTGDFDSAVHRVFLSLGTATERTAAAMRYYLHAPLLDTRWGWAIVNSSVGDSLYGTSVTQHARATIQEGIDAGEFTVASAQVGADFLLGTGMSATVTQLRGGAPRDYPEQVARHMLLALGASPRAAVAAVARPMSSLPRLEMSTEFFRGVLGGKGHGKPAPRATPRNAAKTDGVSRRAGAGSRPSGRSRARVAPAT